MRFWLFVLAFLGLIGYFCWDFFTESEAEKLGFDGSIKKIIKEKSSDSKNAPLFSSGRSRSNSDFSHPPVVVSRYIFKHRSLSGILLPDSSNSSSSGRTPLRVLSDPASNAVVITGHMDEVANYSTALEYIDLAQESCKVRAWVVFVRDATSDGFDLSFEFGQAVNTRYGIVDGSQILANVGLSSISAKLELLKERGSVEVVQSPHLMLTHGYKSQISTGQEVAVPVSTTNQGVTSQTIEFRKVGLTLDIMPHFLSGDRVRLQVDQRNELISQYRLVGDIEVPELSTQSLNTTVDLSIGHVVVLGGVQSHSISKVKGWFKNGMEVERGKLYVVMATYRDDPRAMVVTDGPPEEILNISHPLLPLKPSK